MANTMYFMGPLYHHHVEAAKRKKVLVLVGLSMFALLLILRGWDIYGETLPWEAQNSLLKSIMSFLNYTKYPPSLDFLLLTLGIGCLLLSYFERVSGRFLQIFKVYGSAPMFFYIVLLYALLVLHGLLMVIFGSSNGEIFRVDHVYQLGLISIGLAVLLYFPTKKFSRYKHQSTSKLIKYF